MLLVGGAGGWPMLNDQTAFDYVRAAERMRIAQHLHNSTAQLLAVLQLNLGRIRRQGIASLECNISECEEIIAQIGRQVREIGDGEPD
jgi:signal transduction histidine kinase